MTTMATQNLQALSDKDPRNLPPGNVAEVPLDPDTVGGQVALILNRRGIGLAWP